jgi:ParB/RepB/Spo0J family partition protein
VSLRDVTREFGELPLAAIDRPMLDARIDRDPQKLEELAHDIAKRGVILPIAVARTGDRYEIVDGFSRYIAAERAHLATIPCVIYPSKDAGLEGVKYAANLFRQDMSPSDEAVFFNELLEKECGQDFERLCTLVGRGEAYVDSRLALLNGDPDVFEAVKDAKIKLGVAAELNKIADEGWRRYYLKHAIQGGATVAMVNGWRTDHERWHNPDNPQPPETPAPAVQVVENSYNPHRCEICGKVDPRYVPETISVHTHCKVAILEPLLEAYRGGNG